MRTAVIFVFVLSLIIGQTITHPLRAQSSDFVEGVVSDAVTSEPVAFAQIRLKINQLTLYTNSEGTFRLPKNSAFLFDSIIITGIGFKKYSIAFGDLNDRQIKNIRLLPSNTGAIIRVSARDEKLNSITLLRGAIGNLTTRYPVSPFGYIAYYRDYQKKDSSYINLNEATIQTFDKGFLSTSDSNIYEVLNFRKNPGFTRMNIIPANTEPESKSPILFDKLLPESVYHEQDGNEFLTLSTHDPIRNFDKKCFPFAGILSENFIDNHNFSPPSEVLNDQLRLFKIAFNGKTGIIGDSILVSGFIYIQPDNYSIHKLEYSCYINVKGKRLKKLFSINVEYGNDYTIDSLMHLKYISVSRFRKVYDNEDRSFFRLLNSYWSTSTNINPTLALRFNNRVDQSTAIQQENFQIMIGKREIHVKNVQVVGENIYLRLDKEVAKELKDSCEIFVGLLKDQYGNILGNHIPIEIYQYGEMFVQDLSSVSDTTMVTGKKAKYWMNTPGNIKIRK